MSTNKLNLGTDWSSIIDPPDSAERWMLEIRREGKMLMRLDYTGGVEFGKDYSPEAAVEIFWESLRLTPEMVEKWCKANGYTVLKDGAA